MLLCKQVIESGVSECGEKICCCECKKSANCEFVCDSYKDDPNAICIDAVVDQKSLVPFEQKHLTLIQETIAAELEDIAVKKKKEALREAWKNAMEEHGVKSCSVNNLKVTYIAESQSVSIDTAKLKKERPDIAEAYKKVTTKKAYVKMEVK